jgi:isopenicillin-N epimerase
MLSGILPGGLAQLASRNHELVFAARERLCGALGIDPPAPERMIGSLAAIPLEAGAWDEPANDPLRDTLYERHGIEVFAQRWPRLGLRILRISAQAYNTLADYERLLAALEREAITG